MVKIERVTPRVLNEYYLDRLRCLEITDAQDTVTTKGEMSLEERYLKLIKKIELQTEENIIKLLRPLGIIANTKSDRFSLPYQQEILIEKKYHHVMFRGIDTIDLKRAVVKELLVNDIDKIRFYVFISVEIPDWIYLNITYRFRYYKHMK